MLRQFNPGNNMRKYIFFVVFFSLLLGCEQNNKSDNTTSSNNKSRENTQEEKLKPNLVVTSKQFVLVGVSNMVYYAKGANGPQHYSEYCIEGTVLNNSTCDAHNVKLYFRNDESLHSLFYDRNSIAIPGTQESESINLGTVAANSTKDFKTDVFIRENKADDGFAREMQDAENRKACIEDIDLSNAVFIFDEL